MNQRPTDVRPVTSAAEPCRSVSSRILLACLAAASLLGTPSSMAQDSPRELRQSAYAKLQQGAFGDAIPDFQQLISYLGNSEVSSIKQQMEMVYFNLAICYFFIGQFDNAEEGFNTYLKKYRTGAKCRQAAIYIADTKRFRNKLDEAIKGYNNAMRKYSYARSEKADIYASIARCLLAEDKWQEAIEPLSKVYAISNDFMNRNWAATLLTTAYFKNEEIEKIFPLVPVILRRNSFASRSVVFNLSALEAADALFAEEHYRTALWVYRLVYPHDLVMVRSQEYLEWLQRQAEIVKRTPGDPRRLMRIQESIAEAEQESKALEESENYDIELQYRIARGYMEAMRYWEAREIFLHLHDTDNADLAEESLFLAYQCSVQLPPWDRAYELGRLDMDEYPGGTYYDMLTLSMGQLYAREENWPMVIKHLTESLNTSPGHASGAECMFLIGYASFMQEEFEDAIAWLDKMVARYPESDLVPPGIYWSAMAYLFQAKYAEAAKGFDRLLEGFPQSTYVEDASFRRAVCAYGLSEYEDSENRLTAFIASHPASKLVAEGTMMLGDIAGVAGRLDEAISLYQKAMQMPEDNLNIEFYNHCAFQTGRILSEDERYDSLKEHFQRYIERKREGSNIPQAVYWVGIALWNSGEGEGAMSYYREAVENFGQDRTAIGIDMILDEWIGRTKRSGKEEARRAWNELHESLDKAEQAGRKSLELRLRRVVLFDPNIKTSVKQATINELLSAATIPHASPAVLQKMLDLAREQERSEFAVLVARHIIETFTETDYALDARMVLADFSIKHMRTATGRDEKEKYYSDAIRHLGVVREVFASSAEAGQALLILGRLHVEDEKYKEADECYKQILGVKGWRNFWPEALYGRGECAYQKRQYEVASAYYERIYLMYSHYIDWTARAYLRRAECLSKAYQNEKAVEVLQEMRGFAGLKGCPEYEKGMQLLKKLGGSS